MSDYLPRSSVLMHLQNRTENRRGTTEVLLGTDNTAAKTYVTSKYKQKLHTSTG